MAYRRTDVLHFKLPRNLSVAPRYDIWNQKYEAWALLRRMGKLAATGFYIPPDWYYHFRMFPPISHNFQEEQTLNPYNDSEPTQSEFATESSRRALRDELARHSRGAATEGNRYMSLYWVQRPIDQMERRYWHYTRALGFHHELAIKKVIQEYHEEKGTRRRAAMIQSEEALLSGKFVTMREAMSVLEVLKQAQTSQLAPHQYTMLAAKANKSVQEGAPFEAATVVKRTSSNQRQQVPTPAEAPTPATLAVAPSAGTVALPTDAVGAAKSSAPTTTPTSPAAVAAESPMVGNASALHDLLLGDVVEEHAVEAVPNPSDTIAALKEVAMDHTGDAGWYTGFSPVYKVAPSASKSKSRSGAAGSKPPSG